MGYEYEFEYYYEDDHNSSQAVFPIPATSKCGNTEFICSLAFSSTRNNTDLTDISESGWIWATFSLLLLLCLVGVAGNFITIVVFSKFVKRTTVSFLIIILAIVDFIVCATLIPIRLNSVVNDNNHTEFTCRYTHFGNFAAIPLSGTILLVLAVHRFLKIWFPQRKILSKLLVKLIVSSAIVFCIAFAVPQALAFSTKILFDFNKNLCEEPIFCSTSKCKPVESYVTKQTSHKLFTAALCGLIVMATSFIFFYAMILVKAHQLSENTPIDDRSRIRRQTTITFLLVTLTYVLAYAPMVGIYFSGVCSGGCKDNSLENFVWSFLYITHAVNPIIYAFNHPTFKRTLVRSFAKLHKRAMRRLENSAGQDCQEMVTGSAFRLADSTTQV